MSSDLHASELERSNSIVVSHQSGLDSRKYSSQNEVESHFVSVQTRSLEERDLDNTG